MKLCFISPSVTLHGYFTCTNIHESSLVHTPDFFCLKLALNRVAQPAIHRFFTYRC